MVYTCEEERTYRESENQSVKEGYAAIQCTKNMIQIIYLYEAYQRALTIMTTILKFIRCGIHPW